MSTTSGSDREQRQSAAVKEAGIFSNDEASRLVTAEGVAVESQGEEKYNDSDVEINPPPIEHEDDERRDPPNPPAFFGFPEASDGNAAPLGNVQQHLQQDHNEIRGEAEPEAVDLPLGHDQHHRQEVNDDDIGQNPRLTWRQRLRFRRLVEVTCFRLTLFFILLAALLAAIIVLAVLLGLNISRGSSTSTGEPKSKGGPGVPNPQAVSTLNSIKTRGKLICGVVESRGFSMINKTTQTWTGFEVDLCRAVGAAVFQNNGDHVTFKSLTNSERFMALQSGEVDVLAAAATYTMERDLYESTAQAGFTFSVPYLYNGVSFAGQPQFVRCADSLSTSGNCSSLKICVQDGTTHVGIVDSLFPGSTVIKLSPTPVDFYNNFVHGYCNVLAGEQFDLAAINVRQAGYSGSYGFSSNLYSKEPLALVARDNDAGWPDLLNWIILALLTAEELSITQELAQGILDSPGPTVDMSQLEFYQAVATVGNYAELYTRHLQSIVPRAPVNQQNNGTTPLIYSFPFGSNATTGPGPMTNGTLETIKQRGYLVCGIRGDVPFFSAFNYSTQKWEGFDIDYCNAVSAAIFNGKVSTVFVEVSADVRWEVLASGKVDMLSRDTTVNYERDNNESSTHMGFTFAQNFYTGVQFGGVPPEVKRRGYGDCADKLDASSTNCKGLRICVTDGTTTIDRCRQLFPNSSIVAQDSNQQVYDCLNTREGNAIAGDGFFTANATVQAQGYNEPYEAGTNSYSRENLAVVSRQDDPQWSSFVFWVVSATFCAAEQNITQSTYNLMPTVNFFGTEYSTMLQDAVRAVGSYDDIIARNAGDKYPVSPINRVNRNPLGPQHFPPAGLFGLV